VTSLQNRKLSASNYGRTVVPGDGSRLSLPPSLSALSTSKMKSNSQSISESAVLCGQWERACGSTVGAGERPVVVEALPLRRIFSNEHQNATRAERRMFSGQRQTASPRAATIMRSSPTHACRLKCSWNAREGELHGYGDALLI